MTSYNSRMQGKVDEVIIKAKRNQLVALIRKVGKIWEEDDVFMETYIAEQVNLWSNTPERLEQAIACFESLKLGLV